MLLMQLFQMKKNMLKVMKIMENSLSLEMMKSLIWNINRDKDNLSLRSIVINSTPGKVFSAGHNLKELTSSKGIKYHEEIFSTAEYLMRQLKNSPVPIIAAVDGLAAAAGCQLVGACDIVICTKTSTFSTPGVNFGIFCSTPGIPLVRNVPKKVAAHMLFTGLPIDADQAFQAGLVSKIVSNENLDEQVKKTTEMINAKSRSVIELGKKFLQEQMELDSSTAYSYGTKVMIENLQLKDAQEGIYSFIEKRQAKWIHTFDKS
ncbi:enoyl-CoA hydratase domain-containing protein 3, mitochondrial isoform X2 [Aphidius gifuensis]|uniref:enoyl-CoA hydratase domain-containing protein 3, mitochondrial isoform X2 n=1 Tax=Aphidius gifuensis TaxID=684658 RepID=UPI001CDBEBEF|nr:enoyl-CoA hydratase domain-containing protein 3, mitochondrial isoform X2 [Aphidius gifuensis]